MKRFAVASVLVVQSGDPGPTPARRPRRRGRVGTLIALTLAALVTACGSDETSATTDGGVDAGTGGDAGASQCVESTAPATEHAGFIESDEVWGAGLHRITSTVTVRPGVTLQIDPCAVVELAPDQSISVDDDAGGHLVARGEPGRPVRFERADPAQAWGSINAFAPGTIRLEHVAIDGGGTTFADPAAADHAGASLVVRNQTGAPVDMLEVAHVTVSRSAGIGVMLDSAGFVSGSTDLTVTGSGANPVYLGAGYATNLPSLTLADNGDDRVLLQSVGAAVYDSSEPITWDATLPDPGVAYLVGAEGTYPTIQIGDGRSETAPSTLTILPGVELHFQGGQAGAAGVWVRGHMVDGLPQAQGALVAVGTAEAPIRLLSAEQSPSPADWMGIYFSQAVSERTELEHIEIANAGGESASVGRCVSTPGAQNFDADCSIVIFVDVQPPGAFLQNSTIRDGNGCGVYRGWTGDAIDFASTNEFQGLGGCDQSNVYNEEARECIGGSCT